MKKTSTKISLFLLTATVFFACNTVKRVPDGKQLLKENEILINNEKTNDENIHNLLYQQPNSSFLGYNLRLNLYNLAKQNPDSSFKKNVLENPKRYQRLSNLLSEKQVERLGKSFFYSGFPNFLKRIGEPPVILDTKRAEKSLTRLRAYYFNNGFFNAKASYEVDTIGTKKAMVKYNINTGQPYIIDSLSREILTPALDSLYVLNQNKSLIKTGEQFKSANFEAERERITTNFRNNGAYYFQPTNINFICDSIDTNHKTNVELLISNRSVRTGDTTVVKPFKLYTVSEVNIFTDSPSSAKNRGTGDSVTYNNFNLYSIDKLRYKPKALTDAVFISKGYKYADFRRTLTSRALNNLKVFNYPTIQFVEDSTDVNQESLIANIYLVPRKKFSLGLTADVTHSNIQAFGISGGITGTFRNIFRGAETLELSLRGNIGSSNDFGAANPNNVFFNLSEYGADVKLSVPRIFAPFNTEKIIPKNMIPNTVFQLGFAKQQNIGLDKESLTGAMYYNWNPRRNVTSRFDLFNVQYVKNVNKENYFNVYRSSYNRLNDLAQDYQAQANPDYYDDNGNLIVESGTNGFIDDVINNSSIATSNEDLRIIESISERKDRLTENNLIVATSYAYSKTTKTDLFDNNFWIFKTRIETAGNLLGLLSSLGSESRNQNGNKTILDVEYSQYVKGELDFIKHWDLSNGRVLAVRAFGGIAIPYGNSNNIPFAKSYFAGGTNDIRAWQSYALGPGSSGGVNDFNEANMKILLAAELRFKMFGKLNGAIFADAGNIWNVLDNFTDPDYTFTGLKSLENIALGSGFGFRYDFNFFVIRIDLGFKTYDPGKEIGNRWFKEYNLGHSVLNIGINYPF
ncbi:BamA/TamA family outer membrane protein [Flavobacterium sp. NST-5]|uniref:BamA/TamA family outer membrane protein n=1 Tax=Flavobacterium ichthyis TaxID=2698827 RepID=A0ABW9Z5B6_9FLAO|nr:BamA/TamA family outer membrane protein [Flavobacterium ichthyis]NBL63879.1 BamA/TamA family outer membrane protein [Flavobacterium ichthyis]